MNNENINPINMKNNNNIGDIHNYYLNGIQQIPSKTEMCTLLNIFIDRSSTKEHSDNFSIPADLTSKMDYNNVVRYKEKFDIYYPYLQLLSDVIDDFENSQDILEKVQSIYVDCTEYKNGKKVPGNGDSQLYFINEKIKDLIRNDIRSIEISEEKIDKFTILLILYVFEKCKVLENPNNRTEE